MALLDNLNSNVVITQYGSPVDSDVISSIMPMMHALWDVTHSLIARQGFSSLVTDKQSEEYIDQELESLKNLGRTLYVASIDGNPIGYLCMRATVGDAWISNVFINEDQRGKGIGKKILNQAINYAKQQGCTNISLNVISNNTKAYMTYSKAGFKDHVIIMNKSL